MRLVLYLNIYIASIVHRRNSHKNGFNDATIRYNALLLSIYIILYKYMRTFTRLSKNCHICIDTFDDAFGDNRISVSSNDVYRLITTLGVTHYREGEETWLHESHRE